MPDSDEAQSTDKDVVSREISEADAFEEAKEESRDFLEGLMEAMDLEASVEVAVDGPRSIQATLSGEEAGLLIGRKGRTLDALQELLRAAVHRQVGFGIKVALDVEGYRERRREALKQLTADMVGEAKRAGEAELEPMSAYERKIVHDLVADMEGVSTFSEGEGNDRRVIIRATGERRQPDPG